MLEQLLLAHKEPSDFKEALPLKDVWRFVTVMSGGQYVMTFGVHLMLKLLADSWDSQPLVSQVNNLSHHGYWNIYPATSIVILIIQYHIVDIVL